MRRRHRVILCRIARFWTLALLIPAALVVGLRLFWGWHAARRVEKARAGLLAEMAKFPKTESVKGEMTGDQFLEKIWGDDELKDWEEVTYGDTWGGEWTEKDNASVSKMMEKHRGVLECLETMADSSVSKGPMNLGRDPSTTHEHFAKQREDLSRVLQQSARFELSHGHDAIALRRINQLCGIGRIAAPTIDYAEATVRLVIDIGAATLYMEPLLKFPDQASIEEGKKLLNFLLNDATLDAGAGPDFLSEHMSLNSSRLTTNDFWWISPSGNDDIARLFEGQCKDGQLFRSRNFQEANRMQPLGALEPEPDPLTYWLTRVEINLLSSSETPGFHDFYRIKTVDHAAAMLLAAHLYAAEHGHYPRAVEDIVPVYLPTVPTDPMAENGLMHYRLDEGGPTVWSVGVNGVDDGGKKILFRGNGFGPQGQLPWVWQPDQIFGFFQRTAKPPATKP